MARKRKKTKGNWEKGGPGTRGPKTTNSTIAAHCTWGRNPHTEEKWSASKGNKKKKGEDILFAKPGVKRKK